MRRCLIIDDSPLIRKVARLVAERLRYEVEESEGADEALERCRKHMPDVILLDWHLPGLPAMEFLAGLRSVPRQAKPYILYCTTENDPMDIAKAVNGGCDDFLLKPFTCADLQAKLSAMPAAA